MAKNKTLLLCTVLFTCLLHGSLAGVRDQIVETAEKEIGVTEATGNNDGFRVAEYLNTTGFLEGYPWCAAFVAWVFTECGILNPHSAWCPTWFPPKKVVYIRNGKNNRMPLPGDVFGIYFPDRGRIAHCGLVVEWGDKTVTTIEGNTNDGGGREGDGVYKKFRLVSQISQVSRWIKD